MKRKPVSVASDQERLAGRLESKRVRLALSRVQGHLRSEESVEVDGFVTELQSLLFDALDTTFREVKLRRDPECPVCGEHPTITEYIDYEGFCASPTEWQAEHASAMKRTEPAAR